MKSLYLVLAAASALCFPISSAAQTADTFLLNGCAKFWKNNHLVDHVRMSVLVNAPGVPDQTFTGTVGAGNSCSEVRVIADPGQTDAGFYVFAEKTDTANDYRNGLSVGDLICLQKHILGLEPLPVNVRFAADANNSRSVSTFDLVEFRKLLLGIYDALPIMPSWQILSPNCTGNLHIPACPPFPIAQLPDLDFIDLMALKTGDLNGDYAFDGNYRPATALNALSLYLPGRALKAGETADIPLYWKTPLFAEGIQFALRYNTDILELNDIFPSQGNTADNWATFSDKGLLTHASAYVQFAQPDDTLATIRFTVKSDGQLSEAIQLDTTVLGALYYEDCYLAGSLQLKSDAVSNTKPRPAIARFSPPAPNPFTHQTNILLILERPGAARLEIRDMTGRLTYKKDYDLPAGQHRLQIPPATVPAGGMAVYYLTVGPDNYTGKISRM